EQAVVVIRAWTCVRARKDRCCGLALQVLDRDARIVASRKLVRTHLDERTHERPVLVQRRTVERGVLLERERQIGAVVEVGEEGAERAEAEAAKRAVEVRSAHGHGSVYALCAASPSQP